MSIWANFGRGILKWLERSHQNIGEQKKPRPSSVLFIVPAQHLHSDELAQVRPSQVDSLMVMLEVLLAKELQPVDEETVHYALLEEPFKGKKRNDV